MPRVDISATDRPQRRRHPTRTVALFLAAILASLAICGGCATTSADQAMRSELLALQTRVDELELSNRRLHARLQQHDQSLQLVDDQLRSVRLAVAPQQAVGTRPTTIRFSQQPADTYSPDTSSEDFGSNHPPEDSAPELSVTWDDRDPPTPNNYDTTSSPYNEINPEDVEEIVVTDEHVRAYMGASAYVPSDTPSDPASPNPTPRIPKAPVVHGDRLDVLPTDKSGRVVPETSPSPQKVSPQSDPQTASQTDTHQDPIQRYRDGLDAYRAADYPTAIRLFTTFLAANPPPRLRR